LGVDRKPVPCTVIAASELMLSSATPRYAVLATTRLTVGGGSATMWSAQGSAATAPSPLVTVTVYAPWTRTGSAASAVPIALALVVLMARS
jgi:hypothetical protein